MPQIQHYISPKKYTIIIAAISIIIVFVIGIITIKTRNQCILSSISLSDNWRYSDLRIIDPVEQENPDLELIAVYTRIACDQLQLRLDVLDYVPSHRSDIFITFLDPSDVAPVSEDQPHIELVQEEEFTTTGITIIIPYDSDQQISNDNQYQTINKGMLVYIDTIQDAIYVNLPLKDLSSKTYPEKLLVMTKSSLDPNKTDSVGIIEITGTPPPPFQFFLPLAKHFGQTHQHKRYVAGMVLILDLIVLGMDSAISSQLPIVTIFLSHYSISIRPRISRHWNISEQMNGFYG